MKKNIFLILFFLALSATTFAQYGSCVDTTYRQANTQCAAFGYSPVCGCNSKTYRNECFSTADGVFNKQSGTCEEFGLDFFPNIFTDNNAQYFKPTILSKNFRPCNIYIMDVYGVVYVNQTITTYTTPVQSLLAFQEYMDLSTLKHGMFLFILSGGNSVITKKLIRVD